jgi:hypothetical protein
MRSRNLGLLLAGVTVALVTLFVSWRFGVVFFLLPLFFVWSWGGSGDGGGRDQGRGSHVERPGGRTEQGDELRPGRGRDAGEGGDERRDEHGDGRGDERGDEPGRGEDEDQRGDGRGLDGEGI